MITPANLEYQNGPQDPNHWTDTYFFPISIPEAHLLVTFYVVVRANLGVMSNEVVAYGSLTDTRAEVLYVDGQMHLPAPEKFSQMESSNGLSIVAINPPRDYRIDYVGYDDTEVHVDWRGIMDPWDIHDPDHNSLLPETESERMAATSMGEGYKGHFDMTGRVTGTVKVRGREFAVDVIDRMDHSWGPRHELEMHPMNSISVHFGEDLAFRILVKLDLDAPAGQDQELAAGYVLDNGILHSIVKADIDTVRLGLAVVAMNVLVSDDRGIAYMLRAQADVGGPWNAYPSNVTWQSMMRWSLNDRYGYGVVQEHHPLPLETKRRGRWWSDPQPSISS
ncbi:hypothetical protein EXE58_11010 [Nocardioides seonyuensis]|uniref:Uncharacterized protein n=1 Tax=Nocardioides seonyuensis TaxID=2518371 RepID=A0A4P7IGQ1_9ACTN|nr:hypothetical protein [Nocardioides seonyuensis]QBX55940.1 hypothetical protein EXE58_11010 [Nocardioides seonyuensis]